MLYALPSRATALRSHRRQPLEDDDGKPRIIGPDEFDPEKHWISLDAPLAKALLKKALDDEVAVETLSDTKRFVVVAVRYGDG